MEYRKHTSLKDLAQTLGVSIPTVSRALKDSPEISSELCVKAKKLAKEMNYRPNPFAMSLRKNILCTNHKQLITKMENSITIRNTDMTVLQNT